MGSKLAAVCLIEVRTVQKLRVGHNDRQRRFQLMGGIRHELPLLLPRRFHRLDSPPGQQPADEQECGKAGRSNQNTGLYEIGQGGPFAGHIGEGDPLPAVGDAAAEPQTVSGENSVAPSGIVCGGDQRLQVIQI